MAWNFRKRVKILPGVTLNFGKRGVSTTIGARGASINVGKNGTYLNTGIPGTGLYNRSKIGKTKVGNSDNQGCSIFTYILLGITILAFAFSIDSTLGFLFTLLGAFIILVYILYKTFNADNSKVEEYTYIKNPIRKYFPSTQFITQDLYYDIIGQITSFVDFASKLDMDDNFHKHTDELNNVKFTLSEGKFGKLDPDTFIGKILLLMLVDLTRALMRSGHKLDLDTKEGVGLLLMMCDLYGSEISYETIDLYRDNLVKPSEDLLRQLLKLPEVEEVFIVSKLIGDFDGDYRQQYHVLIYRYVSLIAKCDGSVTQRESKWIDEIMTLGNKKLAKPYVENLSSSNVSNPKEELNTLIGLDVVKEEISKLTNLIKIQQQRQKKGLKISNSSYHCIFTGNPGTGKTTVARIVAEICKDLGIIKKGHLVETDRSGLVAEYVGQTAVKTNKIIDKALDGVLFIDEAYSLVSKSENDYGHEAISTLLKRMEDNRDRLIVILAGYSNEMQDFINSNPGLHSRFNKYIDFPDYSPKELLDIFKLRAKKFEYTVTPEASDVLLLLFSKAVDEKKKGFGNGRYARNIFDKTIEQQSNRLSSLGNLTIDSLMKILPEDIPS